MFCCLGAILIIYSFSFLFVTRIGIVCISDLFLVMVSWFVILWGDENNSFRYQWGQRNISKLSARMQLTWRFLLNKRLSYHISLNEKLKKTCSKNSLSSQSRPRVFGRPIDFHHPVRGRGSRFGSLPPEKLTHIIWCQSTATIKKRSESCCLLAQDPC